MKTIEELQRQIDSYQKVLSVVRRPFRSPQDEVAEQLVSRLLCETTKRLKALEQRTVKIHYRTDAKEENMRYAWPRELRAGTSRER